MADVTVGAGVLLILAALIMPAVQHSRDAARSSACAGNLKAMHVALENCAESRGELPKLSSSDPAVMLIAELVAAGFMTQAEAAEIVTCPNSPQAQRFNDAGFKVRVPSPQELRSAVGPELVRLIDGINFSYALRMGHRDRDGVYQQPQMKGADTPMIADAPATTATGLQPVNHGCMQNVLSKSGTVGALASSVLPANDAEFLSLYLNNEWQQAAGCNEDDVVLATPYGTPDGPLNVSWPKMRAPHLYRVLIFKVQPESASVK
jgi:type II secretory pathway pseudopilin PulG